MRISSCLAIALLAILSHVQSYQRFQWSQIFKATKKKALLTPSDISGENLFPEKMMKNIPFMRQELEPNPLLKRGILSNGMNFLIMKNKNPKDRFVANLEFLSGSAKELDHQQGIIFLTF